MAGPSTDPSVTTGNTTNTTTATDRSNQRYSQADQHLMERLERLRDQKARLGKFFEEIVKGKEFADVERKLAAALGLQIPSEFSGNEEARQTWVIMQLENFEPRRLMTAMVLSGIDSYYTSSGKTVLDEYMELATVQDESGRVGRMRSGLSLSYEISRLAQNKSRMSHARDPNNTPVENGTLTPNQLGTTERYITSTVLPALNDNTINDILKTVNEGREDGKKLTKDQITGNFFSLSIEDQNALRDALFTVLGVKPFGDGKVDKDQFANFVKKVSENLSTMSAPDLSSITDPEERAAAMREYAQTEQQRRKVVSRMFADIGEVARQAGLKPEDYEVPPEYRNG